MPGRTITIEDNPNRNAYICLKHYRDDEGRYILHLRGAIIGDTRGFFPEHHTRSDHKCQEMEKY